MLIIVKLPGICAIWGPKQRHPTSVVVIDKPQKRLSNSRDMPINYDSRKIFLSISIDTALGNLVLVHHLKCAPERW